MATINIIGAGVAGLATAAFLSQAASSHHIRITDKRPTVNQPNTVNQPATNHQPNADSPLPNCPGTAFGIWPTTMQVLDQLGIGERLRQAGVRATAATIRNQHGRTRARLTKQECWLVPRERLIAALLDYIPSTVTIAHDELTHPTTPHANEVLIGADGVHSRVRSAWWPQTTAINHPVSVLRGTVPGQLPSDAVTETWGPGWLFGSTPNAGPSINWFAVVPEHRGSTEESLANLRRTIGDRLPDIDQILDATEPARTLVHGINTVPPMRTMVHRRIALVGDAAHAMAPNTGRGACTAIMDAAALAGELARVSHSAAAKTPDDDLSRALQRFQRRRLIRAQSTRAVASVAMRLALARGISPRGNAQHAQAV